MAVLAEVLQYIYIYISRGGYTDKNARNARLTPRRIATDTVSVREDPSEVVGDSFSKPYQASPSPYVTSSSVISDCRSSSDISASVLSLRYHKNRGAWRRTPSRSESDAFVQSPSPDGVAVLGSSCMSEMSVTSRRRVRR